MTGCNEDHAAIEQEIADLKADVEMWKALARLRGAAT